MASMAAKDCSDSSSQMQVMTVKEKGSRNKRKFRADPPLADPNKIFSTPPNECTSFKFSAEKLEIPPSHGYANSCDTCCVNRNKFDVLKLDLGLSCAVETSEVGPGQPQETEASSNEFNGADWSNLTESQLEELVLNDLDTIFKSAIKKIIAIGYSEEIATKGVLRSGLCYGCKDTASNIVDNTLAFLRSGRDVDPSREHCFEDLQQMEKYILAELVCLLKEVRPFFSTGDAMWCLLICDMNVSRACAVDSDALGSFLLEATANETSSDSVQPQLRMEPKSSEPNTPIPQTPNPSVAYAHNSPSEPPNTVSSIGGLIFQSEAPTIADVPNLKQETSFILNGFVPVKECQKPISNTNDKLFSVAGVSRTTVVEKFVGSRKVSGITKREYVLRQKSMHLEKHYRTHGSKGASRARKLSSFGGFVLDEKLKAVADCTGVNVKNPSFKTSEAVCFDVPQNNVNYNLSTSTEFTSVPTFSLETANGSSSLPVVPIKTLPSLPVSDTELSLSLPANSISNPSPISYDVEAVSCRYAGVSNDKSLGQWVSLYRKDVMIMKLVQRVRDSQNQLHEWTEWANQKVMQAASRLGKDKAELKTLRQEREEFERLKKEKQTLEENTMKKLSEMENAMVKASGQVERANFAVRRLHVENAALRQEMEAAKLHAAESAASCQEVSKREKSTLMKFQLREKQKTLLQEELAGEKRKLIQLQQELKQAKDAQNQIEARWKQEEKAKEELLAQSSSVRKEREQIQDSAKSKEDMIKSKAANNLQKYKDDIEKLQKEISQLRLKTDSSKIAARRCGIDSSYARKLADWRNSSVPKDSPISYILQDVTGNGGVKRERECVMCLSEEMSVVFLPCAHQVVCTMCNELHEKQGMKDCPSCRSPIQRRICALHSCDIRN
ncbi:putative E3 ubiquitin-protein ligase [Forsythia ovata]|uniref:E3 ubiquitin-protein ligase n=1 Tax=Forsythia ovata TaxID=205694 RepID=A0ABD1V064_9LAMI